MFDRASPDQMPRPVDLLDDAAEPLPAVEPALPSFGRFRLLELPVNGCRWPTAEEAGSHLFCGIGRVAGRSYCMEHRARARRAAPRPVPEAEQARRSASASAMWARRRPA